MARLIVLQERVRSDGKGCEEEGAVNCLRSEHCLKEVLGLGAGKLADLVIEAAGHPSAFESSLTLVKDGGRIIALGVYGGQRASVDMDQIVLRSLSIHGLVGSPGVWPETVRLVQSGIIQPGKIVTHRFRGLDCFPDALRIVQTRADHVIKAVLLLNPAKATPQNPTTIF